MALDVTNLLNREGEHRKERERERDTNDNTELLF